MGQDNFRIDFLHFTKEPQPRLFGIATIMLKMKDVTDITIFKFFFIVGMDLLTRPM